MIDEKGYRANVGIIVTNDYGQVLWARRKGRARAWQFPQGGILESESSVEAMYRELKEELGLDPDHVELLEHIDDWLYYDLPKKFQRQHVTPLCIGQKQQWFLLKLVADEAAVQLDQQENPEFDQWLWVDYWYPIKRVIDFKRDVYQQALQHFEARIEKLLGS